MVTGCEVFTERPGVSVCPSRCICCCLVQSELSWQRPGQAYLTHLLEGVGCGLPFPRDGAWATTFLSQTRQGGNSHPSSVPIFRYFETVPTLAFEYSAALKGHQPCAASAMAFSVAKFPDPGWMPSLMRTSLRKLPFSPPRPALHLSFGSWFLPSSPMFGMFVLVKCTVVFWMLCEPKSCRGLLHPPLARIPQGLLPSGRSVATAFRKSSGLAVSLGECWQEDRQQGERNATSWGKRLLAGGGQKYTAAAEAWASIPPRHWLLMLAAYVSHLGSLCTLMP